MIEHLGTAFPVYVNFGVYERGAPASRGGQRSPPQRGGSSAHRAAAEQMHSEMGETLTAMLLSCELAMSVPNVPDLASEKIRIIDNLAREMRLRLEVN